MKSSYAAWIQRGIIVAVVLGAVGAYALVPSVRDAVNSVLAMFATGDFSAASAFMERYGSAAAVVSFLLMVFQSLAAPLPAFLITIANANLFGWWQGAISADMDAAKDGDNASGIANMKAAMQDATATDNGGDKKIVLVCYSGNRYAQAATNILGALGANMDNVTTLEGGMKAWTGATEQ